MKEGADCIQIIMVICSRAGIDYDDPKIKHWEKKMLNGKKNI